MLELKRKAGQCVLIGDSVQMTVKDINPPIVRVLVNIDGVEVLIPLEVSRTYSADVDGVHVELVLARVERGEVAMQFFAPRDLRIDRWERAV